MKKINMINILCTIVFFCIYILPVDFLSNIIPLDKYIFIGIVLIIYVSLVLKLKKITLFDIAIFTISIFFCLLKNDVSYMHIISIGLCNKLYSNSNILKEIKHYLQNSMFLYICLFFVIIYSIIYFGYDGRYVNTGQLDPNTSGLAIFCLFTIIRSRNKKIGNFLLVIGFLTFSKSYLLAIIIYILFSYLYNNKNIFLKLNYAVLSGLSIAFLIFLSSLFIYMEDLGKIKNYQTGINRFIVFFDYSNYHRFTVNTNLLAIYKENKNLLMTGIEEEIFYNLNSKYSQSQGMIFYRIRPHNYFFSYFRIYGIWSLLIFILTYKVMKKVLNETNNSISVAIFMYLIFLGLGMNNYWLYLTSFTLIAYNDYI